jgi:hypothetical protein
VIPIKIKYDIEKIFLILMFSIFLFISLASLWDNEIKHDFPYGYLASDSFMHLSYAESIREQGHYKTNPEHMAWGFNDVVGFQPSLLYHLSAILTNLSGLETFDVIIFLVFIFSIITILIMYFIVSDFNKNVAILSLPISLLIFTKNSYIGFTWGQWGFIMGSLFLVSVFWAISKLKINKMYLLVGIFVGAALLGHTSEGIMAIMFIVFYMVLKSIIVKTNKKEVKNVLISLIIGIILSSYYLIIFMFTWFKSEFNLGLTREISSFGIKNTAVSLTHFGFLMPLILLGIVLSILFIKKRFNVAFLIGIFMFLMGYSYILGSGRRATQSRVFWPIYLSVFVGIVLFYVFKLVIKKWKKIYSIGISIILTFVLIWTFYTPLSNPGLMDQYHWNQIMWLKENTPLNSKIYYFYGDIFGQDAILYNSARNSYLINTNDFIESIQKKEIRREYKTKRIMEGGGSGLPYRKSPFNFGYHVTDIGNDTKYKGKMDICNFDYYIIDKVSRQPVFVNVNLFIRKLFLENNKMEEVYSNPVVSIIKNPNPGINCFPKEGVQIE